MHLFHISGQIPHCIAKCFANCTTILQFKLLHIVPLFCQSCSRLILCTANSCKLSHRIARVDDTCYMFISAQRQFLTSFDICRGCMCLIWFSSSIFLCSWIFRPTRTTSFWMGILGAIRFWQGRICLRADCGVGYDPAIGGIYVDSALCGSLNIPWWETSVLNSTHSARCPWCSACVSGLLLLLLLLLLLCCLMVIVLLRAVSDEGC